MALASRKITDAELSILADRAESLSADLREAAEMVKRALGYADDVTMPATRAQKFIALAESSAGLASAINLRMSFDEDRRQIEAQLRQRG